MPSDWWSGFVAGLLVGSIATIIIVTPTGRRLIGVGETVTKRAVTKGVSVLEERAGKLWGD